MQVEKEAPWVPLQRVEKKDPFYSDLFTHEAQNHPASTRKLLKPVPSSHLRSGTLPMELPKGAHMIEVRTIDMFGREYQDRRPIMLE